MSVFAAGGSVGFFLAPVLATPALIAWGLGATALFIPPGVLIGFVLVRHLERGKTARGDAGVEHGGVDRWRPFSPLVAVEAARSVQYFGIATFIELYWIRHLGAGRTPAGIALACYLAAPLLGLIADRHGPQGVLAAMCAVPPVAVLLGLALPEPHPANTLPAAG